jgi:MFS family permease
VRTALRSPWVLRIVTAYTVNRLGTWFGFIALSVAVYDHTHSAIAVASLLVAGQALPAFVVPVLVARVEASSRRGELSGLYVFEALATAALAALLTWHFLLAPVLVLVALDGTAALAASALLRAAGARAAREWAREGIEEHAHEGAGNDQGTVEQQQHELEIEAERGANAAMNIGFAITFTLGPALAGVAVAGLGAPAALFIDTFSFLLCGVLLLELRPHVEEAGSETVSARMRAAWSHINAAPGLRRLLLAEAAALVFFEFSPTIEVVYAKSTLHAGDRGYGALLAAWGLGVAVGSVIFARSLGRSLGLLLMASTLAVGVAYIGWAVAPTLALACAAGLIGGVGNGVQWAALISAVQRLTPEHLQGRLMGAVESIGAISPAIGLSLGGAITALSSPRIALLVAGAGASLMTLAFLGLPLSGARERAAGAGDGLQGAESPEGPAWGVADAAEPRGQALGAESSPSAPR